VRALLVEGAVPHPDSLIEPLLAPLAPDVYRYQHDEQGRSPAEISRALTWLAHRVFESA
jgi:hypothetical protein